jgi:hypothetical protein
MQLNLIISSFLDDLKQLITERTSVPKCRQLLKGWSSSSANQAQNENTSLISLKLPNENVLELTDLTVEGKSFLIWFETYFLF